MANVTHVQIVLIAAPRSRHKRLTNNSQDRITAYQLEVDRAHETANTTDRHSVASQLPVNNTAESAVASQTAAVAGDKGTGPATA